MDLDSKNIAVIFSVLMMLIAVALSVLSCSSTKSIQKSAVPPFKIAGTTISKDIKESGNLSMPIELSKEFSTKDKQVVSHVAFHHLTGKHRLRWDWYAPDGKRYQTSGKLYA